MTEQQRNEAIRKLQEEKSNLLSKHGLFGGGVAVNKEFQAINEKLERLGQMEYELIPYQEWRKNYDADLEAGFIYPEGHEIWEE